MTLPVNSINAALLERAEMNQRYVDNFKLLNIAALASSISTLDKLLKPMIDLQDPSRIHTFDYVFKDNLQRLHATRKRLLFEAIVALDGFEG